jgi:outer membrane protein OmpA-like peptidoglycan-associated protein
VSKLFAISFATAIGFLLTARANAAGPSGDAVQFGSDVLKFESASITFGASPLMFPESAIRSETAAAIEVTLPADILFDFDKAEVRPTAQKALREVADLIREKAGRPVTIQGYTDALGKDAHNQALSEQRANSVKAWLVTKEALSAARFTTAGFGPRSPVAPNRKPDGSDDPDGRQLNRRVTLIIRK